MASTILVVDDERNIVQLARLYLNKEGFQVEGAYDGAQALEKAKTLRPDLIILDIMMPEMDGLSVCKELSKTSNVPIIILTARTDDVDRIVGLEDHGDQGARGHERHQRIKKGTLLVDGVKRPRLHRIQPGHLQGPDGKASGFEMGQNISRSAGLDRIRFYDSERKTHLRLFLSLERSIGEEPPKHFPPGE